MAGRKKKIWIIGDSTVNAGEDSASCIPRIGWGDTIASFFKDDVIVCNIAISGTSSKKFPDHSQLSEVSDRYKAGRCSFGMFWPQ